MNDNREGDNENKNDLISNLNNSMDQLQCIVASENLFSGNTFLENIRVGFGKTQSPALWDYADGVDTIKFLTDL